MRAEHSSGTCDLRRQRADHLLQPRTYDKTQPRSTLNFSHTYDWTKFERHCEGELRIHEQGLKRRSNLPFDWKPTSYKINNLNLEVLMFKLIRNFETNQAVWGWSIDVHVTVQASVCLPALSLSWHLPSLLCWLPSIIRDSVIFSYLHVIFNPHRAVPFVCSCTSQAM